MKQKTNETVSTKEQAMAWWNNLSLKEQINLAVDYPPRPFKMDDIGLTGREIEEIWNKEVNGAKVSAIMGYEEQANLAGAVVELKPNQCNTSITDKILYVTMSDNIGQVKNEESSAEIDRLNKQDGWKGNWIADNTPFMYVVDESDSRVDNPCKLQEGYVWIIRKPLIIKPNQKQFKQFDKELFKKYIDKFSDEDKIKALSILMNDLRNRGVFSI